MWVLVVGAGVRGPDEFQAFAAKAKAGCPVSKLLNTNIILDDKLIS